MSSRKPTIYIHRAEWCPYEYYMTKSNEEFLSSWADVRNNGDGREDLDHAAMVKWLKGADGVLMLNGAHCEEITSEAIAEAGTLKAASVAHWWGEASTDVAKRLEGEGVKVFDESWPCNQAVAEWALGAIISGLRKVDRLNYDMKHGVNFPTWRGVCGQLNGSTVGLVGIGRVGKWLLKYLMPFDCDVLVYDPFVSDEAAAELGAKKVELNELLSTCDAVSLHAPVIPETKAMIGKEQFDLLKDDALLVNSARAWLLDNDVFRKEMQTGRFRAYLDVFEPEPPEDDDILRTLDNVVMTPHVAGTTDLMFERCGRAAIEALQKFFA